MPLLKLETVKIFVAGVLEDVNDVGLICFIKKIESITDNIVFYSSPCCQIRSREGGENL